MSNTGEIEQHQRGGHKRNAWSHHRNPQIGTERRHSGTEGSGDRSHSMRSGGGYRRQNFNDSRPKTYEGGDGQGLYHPISFTGKHLIYHSNRQRNDFTFAPGMKGILASLMTYGAPVSSKIATEELFKAIDDYAALEIENSTATASNEQISDKICDLAQVEHQKKFFSSNPFVALGSEANILGSSKNEQKLANTNPNIDSLEKVGDNARSRHDSENSILNTLPDKYANYSYIALATAVKNTVFVYSKKGNPKALVEKIFEKGVSGGESKIKNQWRIMAVDLAVTSNCDDIISNCREILLPYFTVKGYVSFDVEINFNQEMNKKHLWRFSKRDEEDIIEMLQNTVVSINPCAYVSFYQPTYLVLVNVVGSVTCLSVLTDCAKYNRYML